MNFVTYSRFKDKLKLEPTDKKIRGIGGHAVQVHGSTFLTISNKEFGVTFIVLESPENILLGTDFLSDYSVKLDFGNATARIGRAEMVLRHALIEPTLRFALPKDIVVPANSEMVVQLCGKEYTKKSAVKNIPVLLEATSCLLDTGLLLGRCLVSSTSPMALLLNHTDEPILVKACRRFATGSWVREVYPSTQCLDNQNSDQDRSPDVTIDDLPVD